MIEYDDLVKKFMASDMKFCVVIGVYRDNRDVVVLHKDTKQLNRTMKNNFLDSSRFRKVILKNLDDLITFMREGGDVFHRDILNYTVYDVDGIQIN
jgi:hypothetical protein